MINWVMAFEFNSLLGVLLYWAPAALCAFGYTAKTWANYQKDIEARENNGRYYPTDTVGTVIGRALVTWIPGLNLLAAAFDVAPGVFGAFFRWVGRVFNTPLVPRRESK